MVLLAGGTARFDLHACLPMTFAMPPHPFGNTCWLALRVFAVVAFVVGVLARSDLASANDEGQAYRALIDQAVTEYRMGNWPEARSLFERAHQMEPSARTLRGMGLSAFEERNYAIAIQLLKEAVKDTRKPLTENQRKHANEVIDRALGYIAQYELDLAPSDANVLVDARAPVMVENTLLLDPGPHELVVSLPGHREERVSVRAQPNERLVLRIELVRQSEQAAETKVATARAKKPEEKAAPHAARRERRCRLAGWTVAGVGAAALVGSLALTLKARSVRDESGCQGHRCPNGRFDEYNHARALARASTGLVVGGGVALAVGASLLFWPIAKETKREALKATSSARLAPVFSPSFAGLTLDGAF